MKTVQLNSGSIGIGDQAGNFDIYHTALNPANLLANNITKTAIDQGYNLVDIDDSYYTFYIYNSASNGTISISLPSPEVTSFSPLFGSDGTSISITGSGFMGATQVTFGGTPASSFITSSDNRMVAVVSSGGSTGKIVVTNPSGTGTSVSNFTFGLSGGGPYSYILGTYYKAADQYTACSMTSPDIRTLYCPGQTSLTDAYAQNQTVYIDAGSTTLAPSGYYVVKEPDINNTKDTGNWYFINSSGKVTGYSRCTGQQG